MNRKVVSRLGVFFIGVPLVIVLIMLNQLNHLAIHAVVTVVSVIAAWEFYNILSNNFTLQNKIFLLSMTGLINFTGCL